MATLQFTAFASAGATADGDPLQEGTVSYTTTSTQSAAITGSDNRTRQVRVYVDTKSCVIWGANPTAVNDGSAGRILPADSVEYFAIKAGDKIAVITSA